MRNLRPEIQVIYDKMTDKQKLFCSTYLSNGYNGTQAAITAGYSENTCNEIAAENLAKPSIRAVLDSIIDDAIIRNQLTHEDLMAATKVLLDRAKKESCSDLKGAIEVAAKLTGANAPDRSFVKTDGTMVLSDDDKLLKQRLDSNDKLFKRHERVL